MIHNSKNSFEAEMGFGRRCHLGNIFECYGSPLSPDYFCLSHYPLRDTRQCRQNRCAIWCKTMRWHRESRTGCRYPPGMGVSSYQERRPVTAWPQRSFAGKTHTLPHSYLLIVSLRETSCEREHTHTHTDITSDELWGGSHTHTQLYTLYTPSHTQTYTHLYTKAYSGDIEDDNESEKRRNEGEKVRVVLPSFFVFFYLYLTRQVS